jgi:phage terminase large subunit GpA-like protein
MQKGPRGEEHRWMKRKSNSRNEVLDCTVYAMFAAHALDLHRYTLPMWAALRERVAPRQGDLLSGPPMTPPEPAEPPLAEQPHEEPPPLNEAPPPGGVSRLPARRIARSTYLKRR